MSEQLRNVLYAVCAFLIVITATLGLSVFAERAPQELEIDFFDIGQGDAAFIHTPFHQTILIDGGRDSKVVQKIAKKLPFTQRSIDLVIVTHPDLDHVGGIPDVLRRFRVAMLFMIDAERALPAYQELVRLAQEQNIQIRYVHAGDTLRLAPGLEMEILAPANGAVPKGDLNNSSIVGKLVYNTREFLFTGDAEFESEKRMLASGADVSADVLKIGHHGSRYSSSEEFLRAVRPSVGVISAGAGNQYGHPHPDVLRAMAKENIAAYRTDTQGDIEVLSDGKFITITTEK